MPKDEIQEELLSEEYTDDEGIVYEEGEMVMFEDWEQYRDRDDFKEMVSRWDLRDYPSSYGYGEKGHFVWEFAIDDDLDCPDFDDVEEKLDNDDYTIELEDKYQNTDDEEGIWYRYKSENSGEVYSIKMENNADGCRLIAKRISKGW